MAAPLFPIGECAYARRQAFRFCPLTRACAQCESRAPEEHQGGATELSTRLQWRPLRSATCS